MTGFPPSPPARASLLRYGVRPPILPPHGIIPARDLVQFAAACANPTTASASGLTSASPAYARVVICGDSNGLPTGQNNLAYNDNLFGLLVNSIRAAYPLLPQGFATSGSLSFHDRSIGGSTLGNLASGTLLSTGLSLPSWAGGGGAQWLNYVTTALPDLLIINSGINEPGASNTSLKLILQYLGDSSKRAANQPAPSVVFITNPGTAAGFFSAANTELLQATASMVRNVTRAGATVLGPADTFLQTFTGLGLIDLGRYDAQARLGFDPCDLEMRLDQTTAAVGTTVTSFPFTFPECDGDFQADLAFAGENVPASSKAMTITISPAMASGSQIQSILLTNSAGNLLATTTGLATNTLSGLTNPAITTTPTIRLLCQGERLYMTYNGTVIYDTSRNRISAKFSPTISFASAPSGMTMTITQYVAGKRVLTSPVINDADAWGLSDGTGIYGGNGKNHWASRGIHNVVGPVVRAAQWR